MTTTTLATARMIAFITLPFVVWEAAILKNNWAKRGGRWGDIRAGRASFVALFQSLGLAGCDYFSQLLAGRSTPTGLVR